MQQEEADIEERMSSCGLTEREKHIYRLRHGLPIPENNGFTLEKVAEILSISKERVRQLQEQGLKKMRKHLDSFSFYSYD